MFLSLYTLIFLIPVIRGHLDDLTPDQKQYLNGIGNAFFNDFPYNTQYAVLTTGKVKFPPGGGYEGKDYVARPPLYQDKRTIHAEKRCLDYYTEHLRAASTSPSVYLYTVNSPCDRCAKDIKAFAIANQKFRIKFYVGYTYMFRPKDNPGLGPEILEKTRAILKDVDNVHFERLPSPTRNENNVLGGATAKKHNYFAKKPRRIEP